MTSTFEFIVDGFTVDEHFTVIGRCGDELIRVGDTFDAMYRYKRRRYPDELGDEPVREAERPVSLRVVCIHAYGRSLGMLGQGMTGSLALEGQGLEAIAAGWVLGRREAGDPGRVRTEGAAQAGAV